MLIIDIINFGYVDFIYVNYFIGLENSDYLKHSMITVDYL